MITDNLKTLLLELYYQRGMLKKEIRSYEVSLWSLQDDFLTVLKWSDVEQKGRIEHPKMTLNIDGTLKFSFSIPMYYRENGLLVENPNWYNTLNGNLMTSLRKVKVIFNKGTAEEGIFEFVITSVTETHEKDILTCEIESEGLAFLELGKIGYKVNLSLANFELLHKDWYENHHDDEEPKQTLDYWCSEADISPLPDKMSDINSRAWYYDVRMNWNSFEDGRTRSSKKVYEESYTSSWNKLGDVMVPAAIESYREKARPVEIDKSNLYNITQTIAETFEIFCRYEFIYDENYHIIGRVIVFYNNFMNENDMLAILYPYSALKVSRNMDSTNTTTKLFILDPDNTTVESGQSSVMNAPPNASKEDYILNFDYMYTTGAINKELYDAIAPFEADMNTKNTALSAELLKLATYQTLKSELEGKKAVAEKSIEVDNELILQNNIKRNAITLDHSEGTNDGYIHITYKNPDYCLVRVDSLGRRYVTPAKTSTGINEDTIKIYASSSILANDAMSMNLVKSFMTEHDDYNNLTNIILQNAAELVPSTIDWDRVYEKLYTDHNVTIPTSCNVDLKNRPIVLSSTLVAAGYTVNNAYSYYTLYPLNFTTTVGTPNNELYDVICTPIMKDGTVRNLADIRSYIDNISTLVSSLTDWLDKDRQLSKLILDVLPHADNNINRYTSIENNQLHNWNKIKHVIGLVELPAPEDLNEGDKALINACKTTAANDKYVQAVYLTYNYDPHFYFDNIIETWESKANEDLAELDKYDEELGPKDPTDANFANGLYGKIKAAEDSVELQLQAKKLKIKEFEHLMGPALREGYWQPEHYDDYGDRKEIDTLSLTRPANNIKVDTGDSAIIAWDDELFDEEEKLYYQIGVNLKKIEYYPCIKLNDVFSQGIPTDLDKYSLVWWANNSIAFPGDSTAWDSIKDLTILGVGSLALVRYVKRDNVIEPVLVIVGAKNFSGEMLLRMILGTALTGGHARLEKYKVELASDKKSLVISHGTDNEIKTVLSEYWLCYHDTNNSVPNDWPLPIKDRYSTTNSKTDVCLVYPRIKFSSLALKTDSTNLKITYNDTKLEVGLDYRVLTRNTLRSGVYYPENFITIKPETLIKLGGTDLHLNINYLLSNMNTSIYLDAIKVSKENAYPKVSYEVSSNILNVNFVRTLYSKLAQIVMVNDTDLKFENTFGYISLLELDLDNCLNDTIEVKNYKTKFEDLFSTIVALTEAMKASGAGLTTALSGGIPLSEDGFAATLALLGDIMNAYIDSYLDDRSVVEDRIAEWLGEAGKIINGAQKSLNSTAIASIDAYYALSGLAENVEAQLTSNVTRGPTRPDVFVTGDIWIRTKIDDSVNPPVEREIGRYVAIMSSDLVTDLTDETAGFSRTHDGSLASITGAAIDVDAEAGTIDMKAATNINMRSGGDIYIAANSNVDIIGNKKVNIGGTEINLCTLNEKIINDEGNLVPSGFKRETTGINLIAGEYTVDDKGIYNGHNSCILINPYKIDIRASDLKLKGSAITLLASEGTAANTSAVILDPNKGIYIGAGAGVTIWGGNNPAGISVYVGPVHSVKFRAGDYWIKTSNVSGHYEYDGENGTTFYSNYILSSGEMTDLFTIQLIYCATNNYDDPDLGTIAKNNTVGWAIAKNDNGNNMSASRANAVKIIQEHGPNGALIELNKDHLLFGYSNIKNKKSTAIELTEKHLIIAAGETKLGEDVSENNRLKVTGEEPVLGNHSLVGAMLTEESIGFTTQSGAGSTADPYVFTAIIMNKKGVTLGATDGTKDLAEATSDELKEYFKSSDHGSYVRVAADGIELGSLADLYVNTDNFKLLTHSRDKEDENPNFIDGNTVLAVGSNLLSIGYNTTATVDGNNVYHFYNGNTIIKNNNNVEPTVQLLLNNQGLYISGNGSFTGVVSASSFIATTHYTVNNNDRLGVFKVTGGEMGFYKFENPNNYPNNWNAATKMLYFNTETGDLYIAGTLQAENIQILEGNTRESWSDYFSHVSLDYMDTVKATITGLFNEAGEIIGAAARSLKDVLDLNGANNAILTSFYEDISTQLTPNTSKGPYHEYYFKTGDIWQQTAVRKDGNNNTISNLDSDGKALTDETNPVNPYKDDTVTKTYIAMEDWDKVYNENKSSAVNGKDSTNGWNRILDGRIASLEGAKLDVDAKSGTISLKAGSKIELLAKSLIDISSLELELTASYARDANNDFILDGNGNKIGGKINISGEASVNIASGGSINLVTSNAYDGTKAIKIDKDGILIESNAKIEVKTSEGIIIKSASDTDAAAIKLNHTDGIYIGTGKKIDLHTSSSEVTGSNFSMTPERILIGVTKVDDTNNASTTAIDMNSKEIIIAAGNKLLSLLPDDSGNITNIEATDISGILIKSDYIGMATGSGANRSLISLAPSKILIGVGTLSGGVPSGSYVRIENDTTNHTSTFEIGSTGIFKVLTPNFYVATDNTSGDLFRVGNTNGPYIAYNPNNVVSGVVTPILTVKGNIQATSFQLDGEIANNATNGLGTINWGKNYDWPGIDNISGGHTKKMITLSTDYDGGLLIRGGSLVIPFTSTLSAANSGPFETPALLLNETGFSYRYFPDNLRSSSNPLPESILQINKDGINLTGSSIAVNSGHVAVNGLQLWEGSILYSVNCPDVHPEHNWVWIKPMSNAFSETIYTPENERLSYGDNANATKTYTTAALSLIGASIGDYRVDVWITAMVVNASNEIEPLSFKQGNVSLNVGITGGPNNSVTVCTIGNSNSIYATDVSKEYRLGDIVCAYGGYNYTNHNNPLGEDQSTLTLTIKNNSNLYLRPTEIRVRFSVEAANSMTPCNVYYFP